MDYELLMESELEVINVKSNKDRVDAPSSPVSIASSLDVLAVPELKPLPGAWVTVGKGGRPVKEPLMYNEPAKMVVGTTKTKKKKKRTSARMASMSEDDAEVEIHVALEEAGPSAQCLSGHWRATVQHEKAVNKGKELKYWQRYQQTKQLKELARDTLIAALADGGMLCDEGDEASEVVPKTEKRHDKGSSRGLKARRKARFASASARCYSIDHDECHIPMIMPARPSYHPAGNPVDGHIKADEADADGWIRVGPTRFGDEENTMRSSKSAHHSAEKDASLSDGISAKGKRNSKKQCVVS
jgi:hypothetical protein